MSMLKKQVAEIQRKSNLLLGERRPNILVDRELNSATDGVVVKYPERGRPKENLMGLRVWHNGVRLKKSVGMLPD